MAVFMSTGQTMRLCETAIFTGVQSDKCVILGAVKSHMKYLRDNRHIRSMAVQNRVTIRSRQQRVSVS